MSARSVGYECDSKKAASNARKHGVAFADAVGVLEDPMAIRIEDDEPSEPRFLALGSDFSGRVLVVVFTWRGEMIRIISARRATPAERKLYGGTR